MIHFLTKSGITIMIYCGCYYVKLRSENKINNNFLSEWKDLIRLHQIKKKRI